MCGQRLSTAYTSSPSANRQRVCRSRCDDEPVPAARSSSSDAARGSQAFACDGGHAAHSLEPQVRLKSSGARAVDRRAVGPQRRRALGAPLLRGAGPDRRDAARAATSAATSAPTLRRIALIQAGRAAGSRSSESAPRSTTLPVARTPSRRDWERLSRGWRDDLDRQIATLQALRDRLTTCIGCGCLSIDRASCSTPTTRPPSRGRGRTTCSKTSPEILARLWTRPPCRPSPRPRTRAFVAERPRSAELQQYHRP